MKTKTNSNTNRLAVYLYNPPRPDSSIGKGSNTFKTTHNFKDVATLADALGIINSLFANPLAVGTLSYKAIKKAFYNNHCIVYEGKIKI